MRDSSQNALAGGIDVSLIRHAGDAPGGASTYMVEPDIDGIADNGHVRMGAIRELLPILWALISGS